MKETLVRAFAKAKLGIRKHTPEILVVSGVIGLVTAGVLACKETTKLDDVLAKGEERLDDLAAKMNKLDNVVDRLPEEEQDDYRLTEEEEKKEIAAVWIKNGFSIAKLYAPSIILAVASIAGILGGFGILKKREAALSIAFAEMSAAYATLKNRLKDSVGEEKAKEIINGISKEMKEVIDNDGKPVVAEVNVSNPIKDPYTYEWNEVTTRDSGAYMNDPTTDLAFLKGVEAAVNSKLRNLTGYVFLNDVLDDLGLPKNKVGQEVGWVMQPNDEHQGDNYIDFGIEPVDEMNKETMRFTRRYILHFNCDGYILDTFEHAFEGEK